MLAAPPGPTIQSQMGRRTGPAKSAVWRFHFSSGGVQAPGCKWGLCAFWLRRLAWKLGPMPDRDNPHSLAPHSIEEAIRRDDHFPVREIRKLWDVPSRIRQPLGSLQYLGRPSVKPASGAGSLGHDVGNRVEELALSGRSKAGLQAPAERSSLSASARTASRSRPFPFAMARSPAARRRRMCRSRSPCS